MRQPLPLPRNRQDVEPCRALHAASPIASLLFRGRGDEDHPFLPHCDICAAQAASTAAGSTPACSSANAPSGRAGLDSCSLSSRASSFGSSHRRQLQQISNAGAGRHAPSIGRNSLVVHGGNGSSSNSRPAVPKGRIIPANGTVCGPRKPVKASQAPS